MHVCDNTCGNWRSLGIVCSHSVVVAEQNGELRDFVNWFKKAKKRPNLTKIALTGMPSGGWHKVGVTQWQMKKGVPSKSRTPFPIHSDTDGPSCTLVASIPTHSPHVVSTRGPSDADAALLGTDRESYQQSGSPVYLTASDIASHETTSTQCLSSSTGVPMQAFRSCIPSLPPPLVHCSPTDDPYHSPFISFIYLWKHTCLRTGQSYG